MTQEQKDKISKAHKGMKFSDEHRQNLSKSHKGQIPTNLEQLREMAKNKKTDEHKDKIRLSNLGKSHRWTKDGRKRFSLAKKGLSSWNKGLKGYNAGELNSRWITDRTKVKTFENRQGSLYFQCRRKCLDRDGNQCRLLSTQCTGKLEVHHIIRWNDRPDLRYNISNCITLCHFHHPKKRKDEKRLEQTFRNLIDNYK